MQPHSDSDTTINGYQLLNLLGFGASGRVYLALYQGEKRAVKILHDDNNPALAERFEQEATILSRLNHPGICTFLDSGRTDQGRLYLAMQYIEGISLDQYIAHKQPTRDEIILLISQCAEIIYYAHQQGVIHRDLKPANILIDQQSELHILDFGIGHIFSDNITLQNRLTQQGQILGTLPYMSPEQIRGNPQQVQQTSDIYSLAVIAYELLTGRHPFGLHGLGLSGALEQLLTAPLPPASRFNPQLDEQVDSVLGKAMSRDPERRYLDMRSFTEDLKRLSTGQSVTASTPDTWYEIRQIYQRHKLPLIALLFVFIITTVAAGVSTWFAWQENQALKQAQRSYENARSISGFLKSMLASADPDAGNRKDITVRELVLSAATGIRQQIKDPVLEASIRCTLGDSLRSLGHYPEASQEISSALKLITPNEKSVYRQCQLALGMVKSLSGNRDEARRLFKTLGAPKGSQQWIAAQTELAMMDGLEGKPEEALSQLKEILRLPLSTLAETDDLRLIAQHDYASMLRENGQLELAEEAMRKLIKTRKQIYGASHPQTLYSLNNLGAILIQQGKLDEAEKLYREVIKQRKKFYGNLHVRVVSSQTNLLNVLVSSKQLDKADTLSRQLLNDIKRFKVPEETTIQLMSMRAFLLEDLGKINEAEALYRQSLALMQKKTGRSVTELLPIRNNLAMLLMNNERLDEALFEFESLLKTLADQLGKTHVYYAIIENNYGEALGRKGHRKRALESLRHSHQRLLEIFGKAHPRVVKSQSRMDKLEKAL